jgi:hypothetical protein
VNVFQAAFANQSALIAQQGQVIASQSTLIARMMGMIVSLPLFSSLKHTLIIYCFDISLDFERP